MKEMIKRIREEKGGFTLAELLIVVAIILILVAIAVPVFTGAQTTAMRATHDANIRAVKSATMVHVLERNIELTGSQLAYQAEGEITADGEITIDTVTAVATVGTDTIGEGNDTDTTGKFTVFLSPTELPATTP